MSNNGKIPETIIEDIKNKSDIVSVIEEYVTLTKRTGANLFGLCPFHHEDTPSFSVSPSKQIFYCFGCHKGGDVIKFVSEIEKLSYPEAIRFLAKRARIEIPETDISPYDKARRQERKQILAMYLEAARFYYLSMQNDPQKTALKYCQSRKISLASQKKFGLGYAPNSWDGLYRHLKRKNLLFDENILLKSGLFKKNSRGGFYDLMRNRLIFPFIDINGNVIAFGARSLANEMPKYINSPETPIYTKGDNLYALNLAKKSRNNKILLVEGYMDVISAHEAGADFTVGSLGTALTKQQAHILGSLQKTVTLAFDADNAGQQAIIRSIDILKEAKVPTDILLIPQGKDPDEFIKVNGGNAFLGLTQKTISVLDFKIHIARTKATINGELNTRLYLDHIFTILQQEDNLLLVDKVLNDISIEVGCRLQLLLNEFQHKRNKTSDKTINLVPDNINRLQDKTDETITKRQEIELTIIAIILLDSNNLRKAKYLPAIDDFADDYLASFFSEIKNNGNDNNDFNSLLNLSYSINGFPESLRERIIEISMNLDENFNYKLIEKNSLIILQENAADKLNFLSQQINKAGESADLIKAEIKKWSEKIIEYKQILETY